MFWSENMMSFNFYSHILFLAEYENALLDFIVVACCGYVQNTEVW